MINSIDVFINGERHVATHVCIDAGVREQHILDESSGIDEFVPLAAAPSVSFTLPYNIHADLPQRRTKPECRSTGMKYRRGIR